MKLLKFMFVFIVFVFLAGAVQAQDDEKELDYYKDNIEKFIDWSEEVRTKNEFWHSLDRNQKRELFDKLKEHFKIDFAIGSGLYHQDLEWDEEDKNKYVYNKEGKKVGVDFADYPQGYFVKTDYNPDTKRFEYYNKNDAKVSIDQGVVNKEGMHDLLEKIPGRQEVYLTNIEEGEVSYENGEYVLKGEPSKTNLKIYNNYNLVDSYYSLLSKDSEAKVRIVEEDNFKEVQSLNAQAKVVDSIGKEAAAVIKGPADNWIFGFTDDRDHSKTESPYWQIDLANDKLIMRGNDKADFSGQDHYIDAVLNKNFKEVFGQGDNTFLTIGDSQLNFKDGEVYNDKFGILTKDISKRTSQIPFEVGEIVNLEDPKGKVFAWLKNTKKGYHVLFDTEKRYEAHRGGVKIGYGVFGKPASGIYIDMEEQYKEEFFRPSKEAVELGREVIERAEAIALDEDTSVILRNFEAVDGHQIASEIKKRFEDGFVESVSGYKPGLLDYTARELAPPWPPSEFWPEADTEITLGQSAGIAAYKAYTLEGFAESGEFKKVMDHISGFDIVKEVRFGHDNVVVTGTKGGEQVVQEVQGLNPDFQTTYALKAVMADKFVKKEDHRTFKPKSLVGVLWESKVTGNIDAAKKHIEGLEVFSEDALITYGKF